MFVFAIFEAEHDAIGSNGHTGENYGNIRDKGFEMEELKNAPYDEGHYEQLQCGNGIDELVAHHVAYGNGGESGTNEQECTGDGHVSNEVEKLANISGCFYLH